MLEVGEGGEFVLVEGLEAVGFFAERIECGYDVFLSFQSRERKPLILKCSEIDVVPRRAFTLLFKKSFEGLKQKLDVLVISDLLVDYDPDHTVWKTCFEVENRCLANGRSHNSNANSPLWPQLALS